MSGPSLVNTPPSRSAWESFCMSHQNFIMIVMLPTELISLILAQLPMHDLKVCALVCQGWMPLARALTFGMIIFHDKTGVDRFVELCTTPFETISCAQITDIQIIPSITTLAQSRCSTADSASLKAMMQRSSADVLDRLLMDLPALARKGASLITTETRVGLFWMVYNHQGNARKASAFPWEPGRS
uniref:F-box domain-containing protein n=1 Tax=Moniliophthora roreri TaxID=221103 RepID=A0A0W0G935_MONRR